MATPKEPTPPKKSKQPEKQKPTPKKNDDTKIKKKATTNGTAARSRDQNGAKAPTPKSKQNGKRVKEEEEEVEDVKSYAFPMERVKRIIKAEDSDLRISPDAIFLVNKATEKFIEKFSEDGHRCCVKDRKKALAYKHLSSVVCKQKRYEFLSDFVPEKIKAGDALAKRKEAQDRTN